ncbi:hypothetical protein PFWH6_0604 [Pseudomonas fluorescens WH6]|nr:hypothetical protein PFWH6_0604 [Pseudomonas fluorescens WH6]
MEHDGITAEFFSKGDVFQQLSYRTNAVGSGVEKDIDWGLGVDG